jgi:hypothetical protein
VTKGWVHAELRRRLATPEEAPVPPPAPPPFRVEILGTYLGEEDAYEKDGETWVRLRPVAEIAGWELTWRADLNKVFAKPKEAAPV